MVDYSQEVIDHLIACPKRVVKRPSKEMHKDGQVLRNEAGLQSLDGEHQFEMFMRRHTRFPENFTIGLSFKDPDDGRSRVLLRHNGPHGPQLNVGDPSHHRAHHIHRADEETISAGLRGERSAGPAQYAGYQAALRSFVETVNLDHADIATHFPMCDQLSLWENGSDDSSGENQEPVPGPRPF